MFYIYLIYYLFLLYVVLEFDLRDCRLFKVKRLIIFFLILRLKLFFFYICISSYMIGLVLNLFLFVMFFYYLVDFIVNNMLINM